MTAYAIGGVASLTINGTTFDTKQEIQFNPTNVTREIVPNWSFKTLFTETPIPGKLTATILSDGTFSMQSFSQLVNATIIVGLRTGETVTFADAIYLESGMFDAKEGSFEVTFGGYMVVDTTA